MRSFVFVLQLVAVLSALCCATAVVQTGNRFPDGVTLTDDSVSGPQNSTCEVVGTLRYDAVLNDVVLCDGVTHQWRVVGTSGGSAGNQTLEQRIGSLENEIKALQRIAFCNSHGYLAPGIPTDEHTLRDDPSLSCICDRSDSTGYYGGETCTECAAGFSGSSCDVDIQAPELVLGGPSVLTTNVGSPFLDDNDPILRHFSALDNRDGNVTDSVTVTIPRTSIETSIGVHSIIYVVTDEAGNPASATRFVETVDLEAPEISISPPGTVQVARGEGYGPLQRISIDVSDNYDTSPSLDVSSLDGFDSLTYTIGQTLSFPVTASDVFGNSVTVNVTVEIVDYTACLSSAVVDHSTNNLRWWFGVDSSASSLTYDCDATTSECLISRWSDYSGTAHQAVQSGAAFRPVLEEEVIGTDSVVRKYVSFTRADRTTLNFFMPLQAGEKYTFAAVVMMRSGQVGTPFRTHLYESGTGEAFDNFGIHGNVGVSDVEYGLRPFESTDPNVQNVASINGVPGARLPYSEWGVMVGTTGALDVSGNAYVMLGQDQCCDGRFFDGGFAELLAFNRELNSAEVEVVEGFLAHRWGLSSRLPPTHAYFSSPPSARDVLGVGIGACNTAKRSECSAVSGGTVDDFECACPESGDVSYDSGISCMVDADGDRLPDDDSSVLGDVCPGVANPYFHDQDFDLVDDACDGDFSHPYAGGNGCDANTLVLFHFDDYPSLPSQFTDACGSGITATPANGVTPSLRGIHGHSLHFSNIPSVTVGLHLSALIKGGTDFTIDLWFQTDYLDPPTTWANLINIDAGAISLVGSSKAFDVFSSHNRVGHIGGQPLRRMNGVGTYADGEWTHVALVAQGTSTVSLYVNAVLLASGGNVDTPSGTSNVECIGCWSSSSNADKLRMDEVRVSSGVKSLTELENVVYGSANNWGVPTI